MLNLIKVIRFLSVLFVLSVLFSLTPLKSPTYAACSLDKYGNCTGTCSCPVGKVGTCTCVFEYGSCVEQSNCYTPPTNTPPGGGGGGTAPTPTTPPRASPTTVPSIKATIIPNITLSPYEERCGSGKCTNGYYCCQNRDGSPACCPVGEVPPTGGGGGTTGLPTNIGQS